MNARSTVRWSVFLILFLTVVGLGSTSSAAAGARPNIVLILADDLGYADLGCYGNTFNETPHIDRLAKQGARFSQFYAAGAVCSPTRASIQSGQNQARFGLTVHIPGHWRPFEKLVEPPNALRLPRDILTLPAAIRRAGYATGYFGKWHLGGSGPGEYGWETALETRGHEVPARIAGTEGPQRLTEFLADKAIAFIEANRERPFLLMVSHYAVHIPLNTTPEMRKKYEAKQPMPGYPSRPDYAGLLQEMDASVGRTMAAIDRLGLADNTLVIFTSDNGGLEHRQDGTVITSNKPLRGEKGTLYEGGLRVPLLARWPGVVPAGATSDAVASTTDFFPTFLELAGERPPAGRPLGVSLVPVLRDPSAKLARDALYWHFPHYHHSRPSGAVRSGNWKLIEFFDDGALELYDLDNDPGESRDVASGHPERVKELHAALRAWRKEVQAQMPRDNPAHDPDRADEWWSRRTVAPTGPPGTRGKGRKRKGV